MNKVYTIYYFLFINRSQTNFSYLFYLANFFCFLIHKQNKSIKKPKAFIFFLYFVKRCIIGYKSVFLPSKASMLCIQLLTSYISPTTKHRGTFMSLFSALFCLTSLISHHLSLMSLSWFHLGKLIFKLLLGKWSNYKYFTERANHFPFFRIGLYRMWLSLCSLFPARNKRNSFAREVGRHHRSSQSEAQVLFWISRSFSLWQT